MMPLLLAGVGEDNIIRKVGGNQETKKHLEESLQMLFNIFK